MIRDVFYLNNKPNAHPREKPVNSVEHARQLATTEHFWIINEYCDYKNFDWDWDFEFLPDEDVWAQDHNNVWPSQHQKDSGTWLCPKDHKGYTVYRADVDPVFRKNEITECWKVLDDIDQTKFDFSWHPDPTDPPYIYVWGNKWVLAELKPTIEYHVEGATDIKFMTRLVELVEQRSRWKELELIDKNKFDFTWRPDPTEPPFIYKWGCKYFPVEEKHVLEYHVPEATDIKFMDELVELLPEWDRWKELELIDKSTFDFTWRPDPKEPPFIYKWGCRYFPVEEKHVLEYHVPDATDIKFMDEVIELESQWDRWKEIELIDKTKFDFTWRPDLHEPPFIYKWGCKYFPVEEKHVLEYHVPEATDIKFMDELLELLPEWDRWKELELVDRNKFDFTWRPDPKEPAYIYKWGCKYFPVEEKHVLEYRVPDATEIKYMDQVIELLPEWDRWKINYSIDKSTFDFSWRPDPKEPPYIYVFGNKQYSAEKMPTVEYYCAGANQIKYMDQVIELLPDWDCWKELELTDKSTFDFSWHPDPTEPPFIYRWGCKYYPVEEKHVLEYRVPDATDIKFMDQVVELLPEWDRWKELELVDKNKFDFTWRPDPKEPAYIYKWGCKYFSVEEKAVLEYHVPDATDIKFMDQVIELLPEWDRWKELELIDKSAFDFTWRPDPKEPAYIYKWGCKYFPVEEKHVLEYHVEGATEIKFMDELVELVPEWDKWKVNYSVDKSTFDFSWRPDPKEPPYIYVFGNKQYSAEKMPTIEYRISGADQIKYMDQLVELLPEWDRWKELELVDKNKFDFSWHPDPTEPPFIYKWGCKYFPVEEKAVLEYHVPDATDIKFMDQVIELLPEWDKWKIIHPVNKNKFDFTWRPDPKEPPFIYKWGCKYFPVEEKHILEYHVPEATDIKFMDELVELVPEWDRWKELELVDKNKFDFTWRPDPKEPPFIYKWGCKYFPVEEQHVLEYHVPEATEIKYMNELVELVPEWDKWKELELVDKNKFDFTWRPDPKEPPFIYKWGCKYFSVEEKAVLEYRVPDATDIKFMDELVELVPEWDKWKIIHPVNKNKFDFTWRPDPKEPPYIYVFGNKQYSAEKMPTIEYHVSEATERKYIDDIKAILMPNFNNWQIPSDFDKDTFDFTWHPDPHSPPYIYQFGTIADKNDGPRYITLGNNGMIVYLEIGIQVKKYQIVTTLDDLVKHHSNEVFWATRKNINYQDFDFTWRPDLVDGSWESTYVSVFGSVDSELTQTYFVNAKSYIRGNTQLKFIETTGIDEKALSNLFVKPDMFFVDRYNQNATSRFEQLKERFPSIQKVRYISSWVDTINRCANKATTELFWIIDSELDYTNFDFNYYPNPWQMKMLTVFGTQWSRWGTTFLVNKETFPEDTKYVKIIEHLSMINFVKDRKAKATQCQHDIVLIDHGNKEASQVAEFLTSKANLTTIKYDGSYLRTFKNLLTNMITKKEHYLWLCSSVCDYTNFDFTYISDPFARDQLHVFPSEKQKFGDTFLLDVNKTKLQLESISSLEDYEKINFNQTMRVDRLLEPTIIVHDDTHATAIPTEFDFPYVTMISSTDENIQTFNDEPMNLWSPRTKTIIVASEGATKIIVPKEAKDYVKRELYDYPYIKKANRIAKSKPLDIVFLSNGEQGAEENYEHLLKVTHKLSNRVTRVDGVNGRVQAYHAALEASNTPWALMFFSKLYTNPKFNFSWNPDRMQIPKHYIFYAENPVNGLVYGHMAAIAYNKRLVLNNIGKGLDFTLDDEHDVVPLVSGVARFNTSEKETWRTAFRECIKLCNATDSISNSRLHVWLNTAAGQFAEWSLRGAADAVEYHTSVNGEFSKLRLSYEWAWLDNFFSVKYKL